MALSGPPVADDGEIFDRFFDPQFSPLHLDVPENQLVVYNTVKKRASLQIKHPKTGAIKMDKTTLVIYIDGATRDAGTRDARASWSVYFGPQSCYNSRGLLDPKLPQTGRRAEIAALSKALDKLEHIIACDLHLQEIYFVSDSPYLVRAMVELIDGWIENRGRTEEGQKVPHYEALKTIHERIDELTYGDEGGVDFKFWLVPPQKNRNAHAFANSVFNH
ncbi:hypothetical protein EDB81DRAFT_645718 [Dactylonectria macrodidyma]|uniref:ribonuclease H n=1 Tax=Dactylonectria macrodidyma TaxID=307937 RepID=A0A9P9J9P7_9HYPO|nr:hypothetical protein EDB81DRAFT_645718 [Dactylonectria macrodidyma]